MVAKQPRKISSRDRRAIAKLALKGMRDPTSLTFGQVRRIATAVYAYMSVPGPGRRGRPPRRGSKSATR